MKFLSAIVLMATAVLSLAFRAEADLVNGIRAVVHDSIVTLDEVDQMTEPYVEDLRRQYGDRSDIVGPKVDEAAKQNMEQLIERQLILHEFDTAGYKLPESIIDQQLDDYIKSKYGDRVTLTKTLQQEGITFEKFRQQYKDRFIVGAMRENNINKEIMISPHKIEAYYLDHKDDFKEEDKVKLRMIVLTNAPEADTTQTRKLAEEILQRLKDGASFADMATVYSQGSQQKEHGDWGWIDKSVLRKELADIAFQLKPGERSGVIETPNAFYIMLVEDRHAAHVKDLSDVRDEIEKILLEKERERLQKQWIDKLRKKTFIREFPY
jgi:parvulin-like peptidyl-prolyl isomerase